MEWLCWKLLSVMGWWMSLYGSLICFVQRAAFSNWKQPALHALGRRSCRLFGGIQVLVREMEASCGVPGRTSEGD